MGLGERIVMTNILMGDERIAHGRLCSFEFTGVVRGAHDRLL